MLGFYILVWPALAAVILAIIWAAILKEVAEAKRDGNDLV